MGKFDYMEFGCDGYSFEQFVFHAKKYTKQECIDIFNKEYGHKGLVANEEHIHDGFVKYFVNPPERFGRGYEDGGLYGFVDKPIRGAFPVYYLDLAELERK